MRIWSTDKSGVSLKGDTGKYDPDKYEPIIEMAPNYQKIIECLWPDNSIVWKRQITRSSAFCSSPDAKEWQCGSFGPDSRFCHRVAEHSGSCSDFFAPIDREKLTKKLNKLKSEEFEEILGKRYAIKTTRCFNITKLEKILKVL